MQTQLHQLFGSTKKIKQFTFHKKIKKSELSDCKPNEICSRNNRSKSKRRANKKKKSVKKKIKKKGNKTKANQTQTTR